MGFWHRLLGIKRPVVDPDGLDPVARQLRTLAANGDHGSVHAALVSLQDWDDLHFHVAALADHDGRPAWLDAMIATNPASAIARTLRGAHSIRWAWEARGGTLAAQVAGDAWQVFHERLELAMEDLDQATRLAPHDPTPWAFMIRAGMGLGWDLSDRQAVFSEAVARHRLHFGAHDRLLTALCAKWGGDHEAMFAHAYSAAEAAPHGSMLHGLIARAHVERWLHHAMKDESELQRRYFELPHVRQDILRSFRQCLGTPLMARSKEAFTVRNLYAFCFYALGESGLLLRELEMLGPHLSEYPWMLEGEPAEVFRRARQSVGYV